MLLYNSPVSGNCYKVRLLFAHLGLEYERHDVDIVNTHAAGEGGLSLDGRSATRRWLERVAAEPGHVPMDA